MIHHKIELLRYNSSSLKIYQHDKIVSQLCINNFTKCHWHSPKNKRNEDLLYSFRFVAGRIIWSFLSLCMVSGNGNSTGTNEVGGVFTGKKIHGASEWGQVAGDRKTISIMRCTCFPIKRNSGVSICAETVAGKSIYMPIKPRPLWIYHGMVKGSRRGIALDN